MSTKHHVTALGLVAAATLGSPAWALEPAGYKTAEGLLVTPTLQVSERWDDNFRALETREESSFVTSIAPRVNFNAKGNKAEFNLDLTATQDIFHSSHGDDNLDRGAAATLALAFDARNRLKLNASYQHIEETASQTQKFENDISQRTDLGLLYGYGAETARGQLELGASTTNLNFTNALVLPGGALLNADRQYDADQFKAILYAAVAPKTKLLLEARQTEYSYITNTGLDSTNLALLAGVKWDATAQTQGSIKVGTETKEFDAAGLGETDRGMWEASVTWSPLSYSTFTLTANSQFDEGSNGASVIESQTTGLDWKHQWLKRLSSNANISVGTQDYVGAPIAAGGPDRADDLLNAGVGLTYAMRRWMDVGLGYKFSQNDSNAPARSFERNMVSLSVTATL